MAGTQASVINASYQQKMKPIVKPPTRANTDSKYGPSDSLLAPLIIALS